MNNIKSFDEVTNEGKKMAMRPGEWEKKEAKRKLAEQEEKEMFKDIKAKLHPKEWKFIQARLEKKKKIPTSWVV